MPTPTHEETLCCGYRKCPTIKIFEDGSAELSDDDAENGSIGTIKLSPEAALRIAELFTGSK